MADLPVTLPVSPFAERLSRIIDVEGKIPRAIDSLGPVGDRDVVLVDADRGIRALQLVELGARVVAVSPPGTLDALRSGLAAASVGFEEVDRRAGVASATLAGPGAARSAPSVRIVEGTAANLPLADASADVVIGCWSVFRGPPEEEVSEADRVLRPGGRLIVLQDYGRDDVSSLSSPTRPEYGEWSRRDGTYLQRGFKIRVIHCFWTFDSVEDAQAVLSEAFGDAGRGASADLKRPRLSYNVAVYHRTKGDTGGSPAA